MRLIRLNELNFFGEEKCVALVFIQKNRTETIQNSNLILSILEMII